MNKLKKLLPGVMIPCVLLASNVYAAEKDYADMHKQINIMSDIIKSSVTVQKGRKQSKINGIDSLYLAGQGIVFTISSSSSSHHWGSYNFNFSMPTMPVPPVAPVPPLSSGDDNEFFERETEEFIEQSIEIASDGYERAIEVFQEHRDDFRDLRNEQRDIAYQVRDLERETRDIEYQLRRADDETKAELQKEINALAKKKAKVEESRKMIEDQVAKVKEKQQKEQAEQEKIRSEYFSTLTNGLAETLCLYGNGLKALPKNERVSIILKSGGDKEGRRYKDKIYVFNKKDISACSADKINVSQLLDKGLGYQY